MHATSQEIRHRQYSQAREKFAAFIEPIPWELVVTQTFRPAKDGRGRPLRVALQRAEEGWQAFIKERRHRARRRVEFVRVTELQRTGNPHFHALVTGVDKPLTGVELRDLEEWCWDHFGRARIQRYDPVRGARYYLGKYLFKEGGELRLSRNLRTFLDQGRGPQAGR